MLINNAGVMPVGPFLDHSEQAVRTAVEVNFYGVLTGCRLVLPEMVTRRRGHIVNIASLAGMLAVPGQALYAGTKFAVVGLSTALADEFEPQGVQISCVMPTFTNTELIAGTNATGATRPVQPEDIAAAVVKTLDNPKPLSPCPIRFGSSPPRPRFLPPVDAVGCRRRWAPTASSWTSTPTPGRPTNSARRRPPVCWSPEDAEVGLADPGRGVAVPVGLDRRDVFDQHVGADPADVVLPAAPTSAKLTRSGKSSSSPDVVNHPRRGFHCLVVEFGDRRRVDPAGQSLQREVGVERPARCAIHSSNTVAARTSSTTSGGYSSSGA